MVSAHLSQERKDMLNDSLELFVEICAQKEHETFNLGDVSISWTQIRNGYLIDFEIKLEEEVHCGMMLPLELRIIQYSDSDHWIQEDQVVPLSGKVSFLVTQIGRYGFRLL